MKKKLIGTLAAGAALLRAAYAANKSIKAWKSASERSVSEAIQARNYGDRQVYFVGGGLASLAGAAYLLGTLISQVKTSTSWRECLRRQ